MDWNIKHRNYRFCEEKLRALSGIETPPTLEARLLAQISDGQLNIQRHPGYRWFAFWSWGLSTAFAAALVMAVSLFHYSALLPAGGYVADPVEMPFNNSAIKQNMASVWPIMLSSEPNFKLSREPNSGVEKGL